MKIPLAPPKYEDLKRSVLKMDHEHLKLDEYVHWDKLRHLQPPGKLTSEQW